MKKVFTKIVFALILMAGTVMLGLSFDGTLVEAAGATPVNARDINYEDLTMKVYKNGNSCVYFTTSLPSSIELSDWDEISGDTTTDDSGTYILVDISWASATSETRFYIRGDEDTTFEMIKLPKQTSSFKVMFDKVNGDFTFTGQDDRAFFYYRKSTDYTWKKVMFDGYAATGTAQTYSDFLDDVELLRFKGAKLVFKLGQEVGLDSADSADFGERPSKEVSVSVSKYASASSVKLNVTKLTFNTKTTMEWANSVNGPWDRCAKSMEIEDIAPEALVQSGKATASAIATRVYFRNAQTEKKPCSQIMIIEIPVQREKPTIGETGSEDVIYQYKGDYMTLVFSRATKEEPYEYCIEKDDAKKEFDIHTAKWKTVMNTKAIKLKEKAVDGVTIYVRVKGKAASTAKGTPLVLPSAYDYFNVSFVHEEEVTPTPTP